MTVLTLHSILAISATLLQRPRERACFTSVEVRARLRQPTPSEDPRTAAVHAAAGEVGQWMRMLPRDASREHRLGRSAARLPSVLFWYREGLSAEEIGRRLTPFGESCYGDRAVDAACALIAALLNGDRVAVPKRSEDNWR
jgi:hypothetical protein